MITTTPEDGRRAVEVSLGLTECQSPNHRAVNFGDERRPLPPEDLWQCPRCGRVVCALCEGGADAHPDVCDPCWAELEGRKST